MSSATCRSNPLKAKLFAGFIFAKEETYLKAKLLMISAHGPADFESDELQFNSTEYYEKEFGKDLKRRFLSFKQLVWPQGLVKIKTNTDKLERRLALAGLRRINIDPGLLSLSKVILASRKDYKHRIFLKKGIYAEVTLYYQKKSFRPWEWTYPDYKTPEYIRIFNQIRNLYACQISISRPSSNNKTEEEE